MRLACSDMQRINQGDIALPYLQYSASLPRIASALKSLSRLQHSIKIEPDSLAVKKKVKKKYFTIKKCGFG